MEADMLIKNWMFLQQYSISSDAPATEAVMLIQEHNLKMLPVVDEGRLRGILLRSDLSDAALCVSGSNDTCEMNYFCNKLKVKDLMVRMPVTIPVDATVEETLIKGKELRMSTFPVMDGDKVIGVVSDREIYVTLYKLLQAGQKRIRITLSKLTIEKGSLSELLQLIDDTGSIAHAIFTVQEKNSGTARVVVRAESEDPEKIRKALLDKGFNILEFGY
jgi:acetoin utilization protein AcuB